MSSIMSEERPLTRARQRALSTALTGFPPNSEQPKKGKTAKPARARSVNVYQGKRKINNARRRRIVVSDSDSESNITPPRSSQNPDKKTSTIIGPVQRDSSTFPLDTDDRDSDSDSSLSSVPSSYSSVINVRAAVAKPVEPEPEKNLDLSKYRYDPLRPSALKITLHITKQTTDKTVHFESGVGEASDEGVPLSSGVEGPVAKEKPKKRTYTRRAKSSSAAANVKPPTPPLSVKKPRRAKTAAPIAPTKDFVLIHPPRSVPKAPVPTHSAVPNFPIISINTVHPTSFLRTPIFEVYTPLDRLVDDTAAAARLLCSLKWGPQVAKANEAYLENVCLVSIMLCMGECMLMKQGLEERHKEFTARMRDILGGPLTREVSGPTKYEGLF